MSLICLVAITNRLSKKDSEIKPHYALLLNQLILLTFLHLLFFNLLHLHSPVEADRQTGLTV